MKSWEQQQAIIIRAAQEAGIDPSAALAIAERESNFNPNEGGKGTIRGMYQMTGKLRQEYGIGDSKDPETQARGWAIFFKDNKGEMARVLGRDPTDAEGYLGHHFGAVKAARMMRMDPNTPVDQVFSPYEMQGNPHIARAGTVGNLNASVMADINQRQTKFGGGGESQDLSEFGTLANEQPSNGPAKINMGASDGPNAFIVHHTGGRGDPANVVADWRANRPGVGAQYIMDRDGVIHDTAAEYGYGGHGHMITGSGAGAGLHNGNTVGMEVVARDNNDVTPAQIAAGHAFIQKNYPNTPVYGHGEVNPGHREADEGMGIVNSVRGERAHPVDLSPYGTVASEGPDPEPQPQPSAPVAQGAPDLASLGTPVA